MFKNVASQKFVVFAFDSTTNLPKTGDAANITAYVSKDFGTVTVLGDTSATEMDATNAKGYYLFDATQAETNADLLLVSAKSSTTNIVVVGAPAAIFTFPTTGILAPATAGRTLVVDAAGLADANTVKLGPSGSGTAQTARDIGSGVNVAAFGGTNGTFASGRPEVNTTHIAGTISPAVAGKVGIDLAQINEPAAGTFPTTGIIDMGTAQSVPDSTHLQIRAAAAFADHELKGATLLIESATTGAGQRVIIDDNVGSTDTVSFVALPTALTGTVKYRIFATPPASSASPAPVNMTQILGTAVATPATPGVLDTNVKNVNNVSASPVTTIGANVGTTQPVNFTGTGASALAKSDMVDIAGAAVSTATAQLGVNAVQAGGTAWGSGAITAASIAAAALTNAKFAADTGLVPIRAGTAQSGSTATTLKLDAGASASDNFYNNTLVAITGGTGAGQARFVTAYVGSTKVCTVATWVATPDNTSTFAILPFDAVAGASAPTAAQNATAVWQDLLAGSDFSTVGSIGKLLKDDINAALTTLATSIAIAAVQSDTDDIQTRLTTLQADTDDIQTRLPAALVSGRIDASIGAAAANTINANALATDAVTEIVTAIFARSFSAALQSKSFDQIIAAIVAMVAGPTTGGGTTTEVFKTPDGTTAVTVVNDGTNRTTTTIA